MAAPSTKRTRDCPEHEHLASPVRGLLVGGLLLAILASLSCFKHQFPQENYDHIYQEFLQGGLSQCEADAANQYKFYRKLNPGWASKFANLEAECLIWAGLSEKALAIYAPRNLTFDSVDSRIFALSLEGAANRRLRHFTEAHELLQQADSLCQRSTLSSCGNVWIGMGMLSLDEGEADAAEKRFSDALAFARTGKDQFTEATALLDLGLLAHRQRHFDEAADRIAETIRLADAMGAREIAQNALDNLAWVYYRLGNFAGALESFNEAERRASSHDDFIEQVSCLTGIGKVEFEQSHFVAAAEAFRKALELEEKVSSDDYVYMAQVPLAQLALQRGALADAEARAEKAIELARAAKSREDELYPILIQGQIAERRGDSAGAARKFREVEEEKQTLVFVKWEAQRLLASLAEQRNDIATADREYRAALVTFEGTRPEVHNEDLKLSYLSNGARIYDDYLRFLVVHGRTEEALRWADYSRARTLAQGLGVLPKTPAAGPPPLAAQATARKVRGTLLFYWLGEKESYLWAVTSSRTAIFTLPAGAEIEAAVQRYRSAIQDGPDVLESADENGRLLYRTLIAPAQSLVGKDAKVFIVPDGQLNFLNFETLLVPAPKLHYWIDDVTIANASSLRMLDAWAKAATRAKGDRSLLLVGDPLPLEKYPAPRKARAQMDIVNAHFVGAERKVQTGAEANAAAYLEGHPENYSYIHFVTHGIASRLSPLDSAIVLSQSTADSDSFKLYAREIVQRPLRAELVTIAACYGAKGPSYSGEGLVGLSWAFLRAGAHNVVAALWEVTDAPTPQQMDEFYGRIESGKSPMASLRMSKLALLHQDPYRNPHYWATFQLYVGAGAQAKVGARALSH